MFSHRSPAKFHVIPDYAMNENSYYSIKDNSDGVYIVLTAGRMLPGSYGVGQNIGRGHRGWGHLIRNWHSEYKDLEFGEYNNSRVRKESIRI